MHSSISVVLLVVIVVSFVQSSLAAPNNAVRSSPTPFPVPPHTDPKIPVCNRRLGTSRGRTEVRSTRNVQLRESSNINNSNRTFGIFPTVSTWERQVAEILNSTTGRQSHQRNNNKKAKKAIRGGRDTYNLDMSSSIDIPVTYLGGPVMTGCPINLYVIYYGPFSSMSKSIIETFLSDLDSSSYWRMSGRYYDTTNTVGPLLKLATRIVTNYIPFDPLLLTGEDLEGIIYQAIDQNRVPLDGNGIYIVLTGNGVKIDYYGTPFCPPDGSFQFGFCGLHATRSVSQNGINLKYIAVGTPSEDCYYGCDVKNMSPNFDRPSDMIVRVLAHELFESVTDPDGSLLDSDGNYIGVLGWVDEYYNIFEISDLCAYTYGDVYMGRRLGKDLYYNVKIKGNYYLLQQIWRLPTQNCGLEDALV